MRAKVIFIVVILAYISPSFVHGFPVQHSKPDNSSAFVPHIQYLRPSQPTINKRSDELINQQPENVRHVIATEQRQGKQEDRQLINQQPENVRHVTATEQRRGKQEEREFVNQEPETVRHVTGKQEERQDGVKQVKKEKALITIEDEHFPTLEELRAKCQYFSRLFDLSTSGNSFLENHANVADTTDVQSGTIAPPRAEDYNRPVIEVTRRPVYIRNRPTFIQKNNGGFYVTVSPSGNEITTTRKPFWGSSTTYTKIAYTSLEHTTTKSTTTTPVQTTTTTRTTPKAETVDTTTTRPKIKIKYTKFEPVILQKTILTDGRVMYHWHRSLPTASVDSPAPIAPNATPIMAPSGSEYSPVPAAIPISQRDLVLNEATTTMQPNTSSSSTTVKSSWLFIPFSSFFGGSQVEETTTVESQTTPPPTTSTSTTTTTTIRNIEELSSTLKPISQTANEDIELKQLKLVVPLHYDEIDASLDPQNNRFGYYRKSAGTPNRVVPPPPAVQVIKTLGVPQSIPRYSLASTGSGYGLTYNNGMKYEGSYGPEFLNYQAYNDYPLQRENKKLDDVSVNERHWHW